MDENSKNILHLDDDPLVLNELSTIFGAFGIKVFSFTNAEAANDFLKKQEIPISLAIVDLFLEGDQGMQLSSDFIQNVLIPEGINYVRLTSAPRMVPAELRGAAVFDKRNVFRSSDEFVKKIIENF